MEAANRPNYQKLQGKNRGRKQQGREEKVQEPGGKEKGDNCQTQVKKHDCMTSNTNPAYVIIRLATKQPR